MNNSCMCVNCITIKVSFITIIINAVDIILHDVDATGETICQPMCVDSQSQSLECDDFGTSED